MGQLFAGWQRTLADDPEQAMKARFNKNNGLEVRWRSLWFTLI